LNDIEKIIGLYSAAFFYVVLQTVNVDDVELVYLKQKMNCLGFQGHAVEDKVRAKSYVLAAQYKRVTALADPDSPIRGATLPSSTLPFPSVPLPFPPLRSRPLKYS